MLKSFFAKRRQKQLQKSENPFEMFSDYLDCMKNNTPEDYEGMHYELLTVSHFLISTEFESPVQQFNNGAAVYYGLPTIKNTKVCQNNGDHEVCTYKLRYKDNVISWQSALSPLDSEFEIFMISQLVAQDIEIRLDVTSNAQDDRQFFSLSPNIWQQLQNEFGEDFVKRYFEPLPEEFYEPDYVFTMISASKPLQI